MSILYYGKIENYQLGTLYYSKIVLYFLKFVHFLQCISIYLAYHGTRFLVLFCFLFCSSFSPSSLSHAALRQTLIRASVDIMSEDKL